jgi:hypothetical protein
MLLQVPDSKRGKNYLTNYREVGFTFNRSKIIVAGLAHPKRYSSSKDDAGMRKSMDIINENFDTIISLDADHKDIINYFKGKRSANQGYAIVVQDFTAPTIEQFQEVYKIVRQEAEQGRNVAVHCGEGYGRTGTVLAGLALQEALEAEFLSNPGNFANYNIKLSKTVHLGHYSDVSKMQVSPAVLAAVEKIRAAHIGSPNTHGSSVENTKQIQSLLDLEKSLVKKYQEAYKKSTSEIPAASIEALKKAAPTHGPMLVNRLSEYINQRFTVLASSIQDLQNQAKRESVEQKPSNFITRMLLWIRQNIFGKKVAKITTSDIENKIEKLNKQILGLEQDWKQIVLSSDNPESLCKAISEFLEKKTPQTEEKKNTKYDFSKERKTMLLREDHASQDFSKSNKQILDLEQELSAVRNELQTQTRLK